MEIDEIKSKLTLKEVLYHYGLKPDKQARLHCPFHEDKTPSMQVYYKTQTCYCFSSNCPTSGKSLDVIDFIEQWEKSSKHEAILQAKALIAGGRPSGGRPSGEASPAEQLSRVAVLTKLFTYFKNAVYNSKPAQDYLQQRGLDYAQLEVGYNSGQFHHGSRKNPALIASCVKVGLLLERGVHGPTQEKAYSSFGKGCLVFPLRNQQHQIVGLYFRSTRDEKDKRHYYLKERQGLYPCYPPAETTKLILTESIIDAASLLQQESISQAYSILALYGTNGLTEEHQSAIKTLLHLQEVIFFLNGDEPGRKAVAQHRERIKALLPGIAISQVAAPQGEDVNSLLQSHEPGIFSYLLESRTPLNAAPIEGSVAPAVPLAAEPSEERKKLPLTGARLLTDNPDLLIYQTAQLRFTLLGGMHMKHLDRLRVTLKTQPLHKAQSYRQSLDLYRDEQVERYIRKASEKLALSSSLLVEAMQQLTDALEQHRLQQREPAKTTPKKRVLSQEREQAAIAYLQGPDLLRRTNADLESSGIVGEPINRLILWLVFTSRLRARPLHVICLGESGTGKTYLQEKIADLIPEEDKLSITLLSENALYYFGKQELSHKLILLEDMDAAQDERILYAIRELQTKRSISKSVVLKDSRGELRTVSMQVNGPISLAGTTTREKLYEDNANRCLLIYLDNSEDQQEKIMAFQRQQSAGRVNTQQQDQGKELLGDVQSLLKPITVRNPYAEQLHLPPAVFKPLRTQEHYLLFIETVTFYHQYQRQVKTDPLTQEPYIETTLEDIKAANHLLKKVLLSKSDELSGACRKFLERLKHYIQQQEQPSFYGQAVRKTFRMSPATVKRHLYALVQYGYVKIAGGSKYKGYEYEVVDREEYRQLTEQLYNALEQAYQRLTPKS